MNDIDELKQYALVHARSHRLPAGYYRELLAGIDNDSEGADGSWAREWYRAGERLERDGQLLDACQHYTMARFPFVDGPARQRALEQAVRTMDRWRTQVPGIERLDLDLPEGRLGCWAGGLSGDRPLLVFVGGIVSTKEQWVPMLAALERMGMAGVITEMPGVGENAMTYHAESWKVLPQVLTALGERTDVSRTYLIALSFSGHMAIRCAPADHRIKGIMTVGAPIQDFFTDTTWRRGLPKVTVDTLAHLTGVAPARVGEHLSGWALSERELRNLPVPLAYAASRRDEIIPAGDPALLRKTVPRLRLVEYDDVHGSPRHLPEMQLWGLLSILRMHRVFTRTRAAMELTLLKYRVRRRVPVAGGTDPR